MPQPMGHFVEWTFRHCYGAGYTLNVLFGALGQASGAWRKAGEILRQLDRCVFGSLFVTFIVGLFTGMILSLQAGIEMSRWGQEANVGLLVSASMVREMGPVMTAFILAGLVGSTMAAELGTMNVSEEIDALEVMSISPLRYLVMPRVLALALAAPALTIFVDAVGVAGGAVVARSLLGVDYATYIDKARDVLEVKDVLGGLLKAFVFGVTIATIGCAQGLRAENGAEGVGRATMRSVVMSFIYVLIFDYLVAWALY
jgi:phospholipid/cholesterol/gamma-HCH transport system permease protein